MPWTESNIQRRQNIANLASQLGQRREQAIQRQFEEKQARKDRFAGLFQTGMGIAGDIFGGMAKQKQAEQLYQTRFEEGGPEWQKNEWDKALQKAQNDFEYDLQMDLEQKRQDYEGPYKTRELDIQEDYYKSLQGADVRQQAAKIWLAEKVTALPEDAQKTFFALYGSSEGASAYFGEEDETPISVILMGFHDQYTQTAMNQGVEPSRDGFKRYVNSLVDMDITQGAIDRAVGDAIKNGLDDYLNSFWPEEEPEPVPMADQRTPSEQSTLDYLGSVLMGETTGIGEPGTILQKPAQVFQESLGLPKETYEKGWGQAGEIIGNILGKPTIPTEPVNKPQTDEDMIKLVKTAKIKEKEGLSEEQQSAIDEKWSESLSSLRRWNRLWKKDPEQFEQIWQMVASILNE